MNFHPDVLAAHAQFGGDLEGMQALYDRPDHVAEIARLQEQVETQRIGHQLTAKEATDYLIRANKAEAGLEEMTHSCLSERAGRLAAEAERDRLREENDRLKRGLMGMAMFAKPAARQKEPQP